jgi:alpha-tubulin suppressor-like RCC1 family protein
VAGGLRFLEVRAGDSHTCGITTANRAYCWGANNAGQLGDGTTTDRPVPTAVAGGHLVQVRAGYRHTCAVNPYNVAFCWGDNTRGQLGDNTKTRRLTPVRVAGGLHFLRLTAGAIHSCGIATDRQAYCWGKNAQGELGDGTVATRLKPALVAGGWGWRQVWAGTITPKSPQSSHTCGVTTGDRAFCWGDNLAGRLGDGTTTRRLVPTPVSGNIAFAGISAGLVHSCGASTAGWAYCWGSDGNYQIGDGSSENDAFRLKPTNVGSLIQLPSVTAGGFHTCALANDGHAYCWGNNHDGQLGIGTVSGGIGETAHKNPEPVVGP